MPQDASNMGDAPLIRGLFLGHPKVGKTTSLVLTALSAIGPGYVIACSTEEHLRTARMLTKDNPVKWQYDVVKTIDAMEAALKTARKGVADGTYKWVLVDDMNVFACMVEEVMNAAHKGDGRKYWREYSRLLRNIVLRLCDLKAHIMVTMHFYEVGAEIDGQTAKKGINIVPCLAGVARQEIPGIFNQVIWVEKNKRDERTFAINPPGVLGVGCQGVKGVGVIPADLGALLQALDGVEVVTKE